MTISKVSVLANKRLETWEKLALERLEEQTDVEVSLVIINENSVNDSDTDSVINQWAGSNTSTQESLGAIDSIRLFFYILKTDGPWAFILAERKLARLLFGVERHMFKSHDVESIECLNDAEFIYCMPEPTRSDTLEVPSSGGCWKALPDDVVEEVGEKSDIVVRFGLGLIEGGILDATEYGVISFHSSDITKYRGLSSTERYLDDAKEAGVTLQRLTDAVDGGDIVASDIVDISDLYLQDEINNRLKERQSEMLTEGIENLQDPDFEPIQTDELGEYTPMSRRTEWGYCARLFAKEVTNAGKKALGIPR